MTDKGVVMKSVSRDRLVKTQQKMRWIGEYLNMVDEYTSMDEEGATEERADCPVDHIPFKKLERIVGFLVYVSQTYTCMVPYLKGTYLNLNSWCHGRDKNSWKIPKQHQDAVEALDGLPPRFVKHITCLQCNIEALMSLTRQRDPPEVLVRVRHAKALYMVGDPSGRSFGCCSWLQGSEVINVDFEVWTLWMTEGTSSN